MGLFMGSPFCSIDPYVCFWVNTLDYCSFAVLFEVWEGYASSFVLFPQDCFGSFVTLYKF